MAKYFYFLLFTCGAFLLLAFAACSIPNLEKPECKEARDTLKEFYSFHFGGDMKPSKENLQPQEKFLTEELKRDLAAQPVGATDYFTQTDDYPKAFRVGGCEIISPTKTVFEVVLFWKSETRSEQREIKVEAVKENEKWLVNKVSN
ncbi:MAG: DUF3828 domain-containing protein [Pyrinomonadaceae bacterium]